MGKGGLVRDPELQAGAQLRCRLISKGLPGPAKMVAPFLEAPQSSTLQSREQCPGGQNVLKWSSTLKDIYFWLEYKD